MTRVSSNITNNMKSILNSKKSYNKFIDFLNKILNTNILEINYVKVLKFNSVLENEFLLYKYRAKIYENNEIDIYIKLIKNNKIKQSIFYYWSQIYEEELEKKQSEMPINRILIKENEINEYKRSIFLEMENNNTEILKYGTKIYLINLINYMKRFKLKEIEIFPNTLNEDDILLVGIKYNNDLKY